MNSFLVVVSHYNAWPTDQLLALLDQIREIPAGRAFHCRVVVNRAVDQDLELPERHRDVEVLYRENTGFNIGAWDFGWRQGPAFEAYLFLQEECRILRPGWLEAFARRLENPKVGLVGESLFWPGYGWDRADAYCGDALKFQGDPVEGRALSLSEGIRYHLDKLGIPVGRSAEHLQALVWAARREVLEATDGFVIGRTYGEAVVAEVAASKRVVALGLKVREVGIGSFRYILHPQWTYKQATPHRVVMTWLVPLMPVSLAIGIRKSIHFARKLASGRK